MRKGKDAVMRLLAKGEPVPYRQMLKALNISRRDRDQLDHQLDYLVESGEIVKMPGRIYALAGSGGSVRGKLSVHRDGYGFVMPEDGGEDLFVPARYLSEYMHGDIVEAQVVSTRRDGKREGRVTALVQRGVTEIVGRFEAIGKGGRVIPDDPKLGRDLFVTPGAAGGASKAKDGQIVLAQITAYPAGARPLEGRITEVLGEANDPEVEALTVIKKYELPYVFDDKVMEEARKQPQQVTEEALSGRTDLRERLTVTIDGETARDFDDAVSVAREGERIRLWVSIADVSHYVTEGSRLDTEAYLRGTSVYFPDRCIPMLPEELSNGICSLNPQVDRLTMTAEMLFDASGERVDARFYTSVIKSAARLTYTTVKRVLVDQDPEATAQNAHLVGDLKVMEELSLRLNGLRRRRGSIDFDLPEPQIILDLQGETTAIVRAERNLAHRIIEEFMLAANEAVAGFLENTPVPSLYRVHENPDPLKLQDLAEFVFGFGYTLKLQEEKVNPLELQKLLGEVEGKPEERLINEVLLRCMKQARYSAENLGHYGLAAESYTHFTSPIRRYPDLVVHRILKRVLSGKMKQVDKDRLEARLPETAAHTSKRERVAMEAEREMVDLKKMQFMRDKVGEEYDGYITGVAPFGLFVELVELFVEGMIPVATLPMDYYVHLEKSHALVGERTRAMYRIADKIRVKVASVNEARKQVEFSLVGTLEKRPIEPIQDVRNSYERIPVKGKRPKPRRR
ncbi:3'-to-5' exoribonuclease RNase R [Citrifermentans bremense]|uniref:Ribonuclease R n=1 Tax=Citrifermentans bremense TaxID=60035 RepID=A0A6S6M0J1_9BACT|nr:ribonuclease R [Citrifermentans bremense]BCG46900.1 3'-to-5' exoribonuclease RNase R [Citrifermentans bremense]